MKKEAIFFFVPIRGGKIKMYSYLDLRLEIKLFRKKIESVLSLTMVERLLDAIFARFNSLVQLTWKNFDRRQVAAIEKLQIEYDLMHANLMRKRLYMRMAGFDRRMRFK